MAAGVPRVALWALLGVSVAALAALLLLCLPPATQLPRPPPTKYGIVLDAGSSHTALFVYQWPADKENETGIVTQHSMCDVEGGGISSYAHDPPAAGSSLKACLDHAKTAVPAERHAATPLHLGATAGMRLLNLTDPGATQHVLEAVSATLRETPFDFRGARILSGEEEGLFGWVTANYLMENFVKYNWVGRWVRPKRGTVGALDLGGASTQITFETADPAAPAVPLHLYGQQFRVYTHSFLCFGRDQVLKRLLAHLLKASSFRLVLANPCWPRGFSRSFPMDSVFGSPCTAPLRPPNYFPSALVNMSGSGSAGQCREQATRLIASEEGFAGSGQPNVSGSFIAFSAFFYTVDFLQLVSKRRVATPGDLEAATEEICNMTWAQLFRAAPHMERFLPDYCPMANFISLLLTQGYGFNESTFPDIAFQKKAGETSIGWALGFMLNLTNMIPAEQAGAWRATALGPWVGLLLLLVAILAVAAGASACLLRSRTTPGAL
ncbi:ectonucleoside triphosphate diphosphohydrolase 2-like [Anolis sagrei]|uniref:ectonucleoside triphosphate diphosphohydrolase 2-like n=1 Tax=Anolis sagrei TaxID=38937 RepID=UPI0035200A0D